jgi:hypothetical protein
MDNPYQSPAFDNSLMPPVEVVFRRMLVWTRFQQIYRFECPIAEPDAMRKKILAYYLDRMTRLLSSGDEGLEFERSRASVFQQIAGFIHETELPQTIHVGLEKTIRGHRVTCHYRVRIVLPTVLYPTHWLEEEVRGLAAECHGELP